MSSAEEQSNANQAVNGSTSAQDFEKATRHMSPEEKNTAQQAARFGYGPLAHIRTDSALLPGDYTRFFLRGKY